MSMNDSTERPAGQALCLDLPIAGMTCAACSTRLEKNLNRLEGVRASVNLATEQARVAYDPQRTSPEAILAQVNRTGFTVPAQTLDLQVTGMTCAACAARIVLSTIVSSPPAAAVRRRSARLARALPSSSRPLRGSDSGRQTTEASIMPQARHPRRPAMEKSTRIAESYRPRARSSASTAAISASS